MTTIPQLSQILQELLIEDANRIGRESGFIQRQRKLSGASFAQSLIFGWQANRQASLEELCQSARVCGVEISPTGVSRASQQPPSQPILAPIITPRGWAIWYKAKVSGMICSLSFAGRLSFKIAAKSSYHLVCTLFGKVKSTEPSHVETTGCVRLSAWSI